MENIALNNGTNVLIGSNRDIIEVVEETCSYELASLISSKLVDLDQEKLYARERADSEAEGYLSSLESKESLLQDVWDTLEELKSYMEDAKRINKDIIYQKVNGLIGNIKRFILYRKTNRYKKTSNKVSFYFEKLLFFILIIFMQEYNSHIYFF